MDDEEDLKKIIEVLKHSKQENDDDFHYEDFINCEDDESDEQSQDEDPFVIEEVFDIPDPVEDVLNYKYNPVASLKLDEKQFIDSCEDTEFQQLLILNRTKRMHLIQLYKKVKDLLIECKQNIIDKTQIVKAAKNVDGVGYCPIGSWKLAAPYFKDQHLYAAPPNDDTISMKRNGELSIYDFTQSPRWARIECDRLIRSIRINYNMNQQIKIIKQIDELSKQDVREGEIKTLENRLQELKENYNDVPPRFSNEYINWVRVSEIFLKEKHSDFECRSFWHIYLHPDINKAPWTDKEKERLKGIVKKYKKQNWDTITKELGTNRSSLQACITYFTNFDFKYKKGEFTHEEDFKLLNLVEKHKMGNYIPWSKIVNQFTDRNRMQLHHRYTYYLSQKDKKKGKFSEAEDIMLMIAVDKFGKNFRKCQEFLPKRSMAQCRARYSNNCTQFHKKGEWNLEDDQKIMDYVENHGPRAWSGLAKVFHRTRGQLRQRYHIINNFLQSNPTKTVADVPRKKLKVDPEEESSYAFSRFMADKYRDQQQMPTLAEIEEILRTSYNKFVEVSSEDELENISTETMENTTKKMEGIIIKMADIDRMLLNFFSNSYKFRSAREISMMNLKRAITDTEKILDKLQVNLEIPSNLDEYDELDPVDKAILRELQYSNYGKHRQYHQVTDRSTSIIEHIPPSFHNAIGIRSLLIKNIHRKRHLLKISKLLNNSEADNANAIKKDLSNHILMLDPLTRDALQADRNLFFRRFYSLFKWSALLTLDGPTAELQSISDSLDYSIAPEVKRTYSRKNKNTAPVSVEQPNAKKLKITELPKNMLTLTPVTNKSVIENLMKDKNRKLFCFNKITEGGQEKTVIKEVKLAFVNSANMSDSLKAGPSKPLIIQHNKGVECNTGMEMSNSISASSSNSMKNMSNLEMKLEPGPSTKTVSTDDSDSDNMDTVNKETFMNTFDQRLNSEDDIEDVKKLELALQSCNNLDEFDDTDDVFDLETLNIFLKQERNSEDDSD